MTFAFDNAPVWLDLVGVFFFAVSGSLLAARKNIDIVGSLLLASLVGLGGGVIRDLILDSGPARGVQQPGLSGSAAAGHRPGVLPVHQRPAVHVPADPVRRRRAGPVLHDRHGQGPGRGHESGGGGAPGGHDGGGRRPAARCDGQRGTRTVQPQGHLRPAGVRGGRADRRFVGCGCVQCPDGCGRCRGGVHVPGGGLAPFLAGPAGRTRLAPAGPCARAIPGTAAAARRAVTIS